VVAIAATGRSSVRWAFARAVAVGSRRSRDGRRGVPGVHAAAGP
jgi:hypothetical protein